MNKTSTGKLPGASITDTPIRLTPNSIYPFMVDLGLVLVLFGVFLVGTLVAVLGGVVLLVGVTGWYREAREEYDSLPDSAPSNE